MRHYTLGYTLGMATGWILASMWPELAARTGTTVAIVFLIAGAVTISFSVVLYVISRYKRNRPQ